MDGRLIHLVSDLLQQQSGRGLRRLFNQSPEAVMALYRLPPDKRQCLYRMKPGHIADELKLEVEAWTGAAELPEIPRSVEEDATRLMHLVSDLMHMPHLMSFFGSNPDNTGAVLAHYGLRGRRQREVLRTRDATEIAAEIQREASGMTYPNDDGKDFPDGEEPEGYGRDGEVEILYPAVDGKVWCVRPPWVEADSADVGLTIDARSVPRGDNCAVHLELASGGAKVIARTIDVGGTFRKSIIRCRLDAPSTRGSYKVVVTSCPGTDHEYVFEGEISVEVVERRC